MFDDLYSVGELLRRRYPWLNRFTVLDQRSHDCETEPGAAAFPVMSPKSPTATATHNNNPECDYDGAIAVPQNV